MLVVSEKEEGVVVLGWSRYQDPNPVPTSSLAIDIARSRQKHSELDEISFTYCCLISQIKITLAVDHRRQLNVTDRTKVLC